MLRHKITLQLIFNIITIVDWLLFSLLTFLRKKQQIQKVIRRTRFWIINESQKLNVLKSDASKEFNSCVVVSSTSEISQNYIKFKHYSRRMMVDLSNNNENDNFLFYSWLTTLWRSMMLFRNSYVFTIRQFSNLIVLFNCCFVYININIYQ